MGKTAYRQVRTEKGQNEVITNLFIIIIPISASIKMYSYFRLIDDDIRRPPSSKTTFSSFSSKSATASASTSGAWNKPLPPPPPTFSQTEKSRFPQAFDNASSSAYISSSEKRSSDSRSQSNRDLEKRRDYTSDRGYTGSGPGNSADKRTSNTSDSRAPTSSSRGGGHSWHGNT